MEQDPIVEPEAFRGMEEGEVRLHVELDGWEPTKLVHAAGHIYRPHKHPEEKLLVILAGSMKLRIGNDWTTLLEGDMAIIPGDMNHEAVIGGKGCTFFWAERIPEETEEGEKKEEGE